MTERTARVPSTIAPQLLASWVDARGSYAAAFYALAVVVALPAIAAMVVRVPSGVEVAAS